MKKITVLVLASLLVLGLTSCASSTQTTTESSESEETSEETVTEEVTESPEEEIEVSEEIDEEVVTEFNACLDAIYNIQPGSAGSSIRQEDAADAIKNFLAESTLSQADYANMTLNYIEANEIDNDRLLESINNLNDSELLTDTENFEAFYQGVIGNLQ